MRLKSTLLSFVFLGAPFLAHAKTAEEIILEIAPESASCNGAPAAGECLTAKEAADPAITAFSKLKKTFHSIFPSLPLFYPDCLAVTPPTAVMCPNTIIEPILLS